MTNTQFTQIESALLKRVQGEVPLLPRPWDIIAQDLGVKSYQARNLITSFREKGIIREISGILDAASLGYNQSLVAFSLAEEHIETAGNFIATHPGISHCYQRDDKNFNLWFTLAVSPVSQLGLEKTIEILVKKTSAERFLILPTLKKFKLAVCFDFATGSINSPVAETSSPKIVYDYTKLNLDALRALQQDLPAIEQPFQKLADEAKLSRDNFLRLAQELKTAGVLRRYSAVMHHRKTGANSNVMVVWNLPADHIEIAAVRAAQNKSVSHCYTRPVSENWQFGLYTMIHGKSPEDCLQTINEIAAQIGNPPNRKLWTKAEFKKARVKFFSEDEKIWEDNNL